MNSDQRERAQRFRALHEEPGAFIFPNPWDGVTARAFEGLGFRALATSSEAQAATLGRRDGQVTRDEALAHCRLIVDCTSLPVAADLEKGFGDDPETVAETIRAAADAGLVGGSIEDATGARDKPLFTFEEAVERVAAAVEAAKSLPFPFTLTARSENFLRGNPDLDDTIRRLKAFEAAGADVLFAPGLPDIESIRAVCQALTKPFNFMVGIPGRSFSVAELTEAGVKRISMGATLHRVAMGAAVNAVKEIIAEGTFSFVDRAIDGREMYGYLPNGYLPNGYLPNGYLQNG